MRLLVCLILTVVIVFSSEDFVIDDMIFPSNPFLPVIQGFRTLANTGITRWTGGVIPYTIDPSFGVNDVTIINALREIEQRTDNCLSFIERTNEPNYVVITNSRRGCNSGVGNLMQGGQMLNLAVNDCPDDNSNCGSTCLVNGIIIHELLHAAGFEHEQNRPDRDEFVKINFENIDTSIPNVELNFVKKNASESEVFNLPYDYDSIMHYEQFSFAKRDANGRLLITIEPVKRFGEPTINPFRMGQRIELSCLDIRMIKLFYECEIVDDNLCENRFVQQLFVTDK
jgi:hypothetical protein